ncbi:MAG TPA: hypothetical protein EYH22_02965 [Candidatus Nanopusillus sp.]|nr:hypothetical protein [Candidatus Nanopusillus sp.]
MKVERVSIEEFEKVFSNSDVVISVVNTSSEDVGDTESEVSPEPEDNEGNEMVKKKNKENKEIVDGSDEIKEEVGSPKEDQPIVDKMDENLRENKSEEVGSKGEIEDTILDSDLDKLVEDIEQGNYEIESSVEDKIEEIEEDENNKEDITDEEDEEEIEEDEEVEVTKEGTRALLSLIILAYVLYKLGDLYESYSVLDEVEQTKEFERIVERFQERFRILAIRNKWFRNIYKNADDLVIIIDIVALIYIVEKKIEERKTGVKKEPVVEDISKRERRLSERTAVSPKLQNVQIGL